MSLLSLFANRLLQACSRWNLHNSTRQPAIFSHN